MTQREIIRGRLNYVRRWLDSVLPRVSQDMLTWAPAEGMRTISGQLVEIIEVEAQLVPIMRDGKELSEEEMAKVVEDPNNFESLKRVLTDVRQRTLAYLESLSEAELEEDADIPQWYGAYTPKPCPRSEQFRNIAEHEFYHTGQLISYLWAKGDDPYKW